MQVKVAIVDKNAELLENVAFLMESFSKVELVGKFTTDHESIRGIREKNFHPYLLVNSKPLKMTFYTFIPSLGGSHNHGHLSPLLKVLCQ